MQPRTRKRRTHNLRSPGPRGGAGCAGSDVNTEVAEAGAACARWGGCPALSRNAVGGRLAGERTLLRAEDLEEVSLLGTWRR